MVALEELQPSASIVGSHPTALPRWSTSPGYGSDAVELTYRDASGHVASELLYRDDEPRLEVVQVRLDGGASVFVRTVAAASHPEQVVEAGGRHVRFEALREFVPCGGVPPWERPPPSVLRPLMI